jgi:hypothetical protein
MAVMGKLETKRARKLICGIEMSKNELANRYMEIFYQTKDFDSLRSIFNDNLDFKGPLYRYDSAEAYITSLKESPPEDCQFEILEAYENRDSVCYFYNFIKGEKKILMAQTFWIAGDQIRKIRLVFNVSEIA